MLKTKISIEMGQTPALKIIIADDDSDDLEYLRFLFDKHDSFEIVKTVNSAFDVIDTIENEIIPDLLLTDFYMPMMTGSELTHYLNERGVAPNMHIFIISTVINEAHQQKFSDNPKVHFLMKPSNLLEINNVPGTILEKIGVENPKRV